MSSSSNSPCAACKCLRRKCTPECVFAPYFPPDNPTKFSNVHKVFGASNVAKILHELNANQCEDAVNSLAYEAEHRMRDPVYGCVGLISILQQRLKQVQNDLDAARKELATYIGPSAMLPVLNHQSSFGPNSYHQMVMPNNTNVQQLMMGHAPHGSTQLVIHDPQEQILESQIAAARERAMMRSFEQQQNQNNELVRFNNNGGFIEVGGNNSASNVVTVASGFSQMAMQQSSLALGSSYGQQRLPYDHLRETNELHRQGHVVAEHELQLQLQQSQELLIQQQNLAVNHNHQQLQLAKLPGPKSKEGKS